MNSYEKKFGFVNVLGATNVGKSTLINRLVGQKISIVTKKVQTTRNNIIGIYCLDYSQVVLIDTPGIFVPKRKFDRAMINSAWKSVKDSDMTLLMLEANQDLDSNTLLIAEAFKSKKISNSKFLICVINKIDLVKSDVLLELVEKVKKYFNCKEFFFISALNGDGVLELKNFLANNIPLGEWHYPEEHVTDIPYRLLVSEMIREKLTMIMHHELPYGIAVETEAWNQLKDGSIRIDALIYVQKKGQKKIVIGANGDNLKSIGINCRKELKSMLNKDIHLFLYVKVRDNWDKSPDYYKGLGLDYNV
ncbi:MAG: GTPase Era [Pelagibacterales bacterium]|nr:GTPase Era [Pelagibacterales bacterium]RCL81500.1 MAG: GTPase Era [Alphaproteobacteria bacterium]